MFQDKNFDLARKRFVIDAGALTGIGSNGRTLSNGGSDVQLDEVGDLGIAGIQFLAGGSGHDIRHAFHLPGDVDVNFPIGVTIQWTTESNTAAHSVHWHVRVKDYDIGGQPGGSWSNDDNLDTDIESQTVGAGAESFSLRETSRGILDPGRIDKGSFAVFDISITAGGGLDPSSGSGGETFLLALILDYMPKLTRGPGVRNDRAYETEQVDYKY